MSATLAWLESRRAGHGCSGGWEALRAGVSRVTARRHRVCLCTQAFANHCTELLGASIPQTVVQRFNGRIPATVKIIEVLKDSFVIGPYEAEWTARIDAATRLRNDVVHFKPAWYETVPHPSGKSNVSAERAIYTVERASEYTALAVEVLTTCLSVPRTDRRRVSGWVTGSSHVAPWLHDAP